MMGWQMKPTYNAISSTLVTNVDEFAYQNQ